MNVTVAWEDIVSVVSQISGYLIVIGILFVAMVAVLVFAKKAGKSKSGFIRWQAVIVFGRPGGEGADLPNDMGAVLNGSYNKGTKYTNALYTNNGSYDDFEAGSSYLELSRTEREVVEMVCSNFEDVIIVYNGANALEMGWTEEFDQIKGVLLCASPGATGFNALGQIMNGTVNPSGKTVDTWLRDVTRSPTFNNFWHFHYSNVDEVAEAAWERADGIVSFVNYVERYYTPPYTNGGIEKAEVNLVAFDKTELLEPGVSETLTLTFDVEDMASFDTYGEGCYVLEEGEYGISL